MLYIFRHSSHSTTPKISDPLYFTIKRSNTDSAGLVLRLHLINRRNAA